MSNFHSSSSSSSESHEPINGEDLDLDSNCGLPFAKKRKPRNVLTEGWNINEDGNNSRAGDTEQVNVEGNSGKRMKLDTTMQAGQDLARICEAFFSQNQTQGANEVEDFDFVTIVGLVPQYLQYGTVVTQNDPVISQTSLQESNAGNDTHYEPVNGEHMNSVEDFHSLSVQLNRLEDEYWGILKYLNDGSSSQ